MIAHAERTRGDVPAGQLLYRAHDLREPLPESDFDVACNVFTSFGYGTDEAEFDAITGVARLNWYWSGSWGSGEKHATWRCYTPTEIVGLLARASLRFTAAYQGLSKTPYKASAPDAGGRIAMVAVRDP